MKRRAFPHRAGVSLYFIIILFLGLCVVPLNAQKGKKGKGNDKENNSEVVLSSCIQDLGNGMYKAYFGYTNPTDQTITVDQKDSFLYLNDHINDDESDDDDEENHNNGVEKLPGITTFEPGTHEKAFFAVFNASGHAKWTVVFEYGEKNKKNKVKIRANSGSPICPDDSVIFPVFGGAGKSMTSVGAELTALATGNANGANGEAPSDIIFQINPADTTEVLIEIVPKLGRMQFVLDLLQDPAPNGFARVYDIDPLLSDFIVDPDIIESIDPATQATKYATIDVYFPISRLLELNDYPDDLNFSRALYTPIRQAGVANTKGDDAMLTNEVRESFVLRDIDGNAIPVDGTGISVAVISDSFDKQPFSVGQPSKATLDINQGDLSPVTVLKDYPFGVASDEGRAMLQLIHDVAPGATLGFSTGILSPRDMALAIDSLAFKGYDIITDDITYPLEPFYDDFTTDTDDGSIAKAIKGFTINGGIYVTSAGNFANTGYQSVFVNSDDTPVINPALDPGTIAHVFGGDQDVMQEIEVDPGTYFLVLQWDEDQASQNNSMGAATDLDIYIVSETGQVLVNTNSVNDFGDAVEAVIFQSVAENARANIMITSANGDAPADLAFRYIIYRSDGLQILEYNTGTPTVTGHAMTEEAITVGAVDYRLVLKEETIIPEFFSSFAGDLLNGTTLQVDIAAPDGGNTTVLSVGNDINDITEGDPDDETLPNFFGTSAAAPHVAGAIALLLSTALPSSSPEAYSPSWYPEGLPVDVLQLFQDNATAMPGAEIQAGSGLINAVAAFKQIAAQTAVLEDITVSTEGEVEPVPGVDSYNVTISGNYIASNAEVFLGDEPLVIVGEPSETEITATVIPFVGNPELTVFNNSGDLPGGGKSNGLPILPDGKIALNIIANNITVEFGDTPQFTYMVEGLPKLEGLPDYDEVVFGLSEGETLNTALVNINAALADLGEPVLPLLPELVVEAEFVVGPFPDVGFYEISSGFGEVVLTEEQLAAYQLNFINEGEEAGQLTITRKNLIVKPDNISIVYGEAVDVQLNYFGEEEEPLDPALEEAIRNAHTTDFYRDDDPATDDKTLLVINKLRAVINSEDILGLLNSGSSWMASENIINNKLRAVINGEMNLIDLETQNFDNYFAAEDAPIGNKLRAVINKLRAVINGEDLLNGNIQLELIPENEEEEAIPNKLRAVINSTSLLNQEGETGFGAYNKIFAVVDFDDGTPADENGDPIDPNDPRFNKVYATNLLSSLDVTDEVASKVYPGAFLSNFGVNFNTQYLSANLTVTPASLFVQTPDLETEFGTELTNALINDLLDICDCPGIQIEGFVYGEDTETVFPEGFLFYLEDIAEDPTQYFLNGEGLIVPAGTYFLKIVAPQNYTIDFGEAVGRLTVINKELIVSENPEGAPHTTVYGEDSVTSEFLDEIVLISGLEEGEFGTVFPNGIPYFLEEKLEDPEEEPGTFELDDKINTGEYYVRITMPESNYEIVYDAVNPAVITVTKKELTFNADYFVKEYGDDITTGDISKFDDPSESNVPVIQGFEYEDNENNVFGEVIPYVVIPEGDENASEFQLDERLIVGFYNIRIADSLTEEIQNYSIFYDDNDGVNNTLEITKADLNVCIEDVELREGELLTLDLINATFSYLWDDDESTVFPEGITYVVVEVIDGKDVETVIPIGGLSLDEGIYKIKVQEVELENYTIANGGACKVGEVEVTPCGDAVTLDFSNYAFDQFTGKYRFDNVATDLDALVTIQTRGTVQVESIDNNGYSEGSDDRKQFRPTASFTITQAVPEPYVEFTITLVNAETNTPATNVGKLIAGVLDVDGEMTYQEYVEINLPSEYTVEGGATPTQLEVIQNLSEGLLRINGHNNSYTATFNGEPRVNVEVVYENVSSLIYRIGARRNGTGAVPTRQYGVQFECLTNFDPLSVPIVVDLEEANLMTETAAENNCLSYNNPVGPSNNYLLELVPKDGVSGAAIITLRNIATMQPVTFNFNNVIAGQSIEINMASWTNGMYIVQSSIGDCDSDAFIVVKTSN